MFAIIPTSPVIVTNVIMMYFDLKCDTKVSTLNLICKYIDKKNKYIGKYFKYIGRCFKYIKLWMDVLGLKSNVLRFKVYVH